MAVYVPVRLYVLYSQVLILMRVLFIFRTYPRARTHKYMHAQK